MFANKIRFRYAASAIIKSGSVGAMQRQNVSLPHGGLPVLQLPAARNGERQFAAPAFSSVMS